LATTLPARAALLFLLLFLPFQYPMPKEKYNLLFFTTLFILLLPFSFSALHAQGNLLIFPKRIVFDGSKPSQDINLANTGKDTARYVISLLHYRMKEDGSFEEITGDDSTEKFADKTIRFFPRTVVLAPGESQLVRVQQVRGSLPSGEYRSHMYFRSQEQDMSFGSTEQKKKRDGEGISIQLTPVFGLSIPVIVRSGEGDSKINLSDASFKMYEAKTPVLLVKLNRLGAFSAYADLSVEYISPEGQRTKVGGIQGVAVYTPNRSRTIRVLLSTIAGIDYTKGKLHLLFKSQSDVKPVIEAEAELALH
jgi:hypothetical protein